MTEKESAMTAQFPNPAELYERFYGPAMFRPLTEVFVPFAGPKRGERALDLACGTGLVARHVAPLVGEDGRVVAVDINPAMLEVARKQPAPAGAAIEWLEGDALMIDLSDHEFDLVLCQQGLQFFADRAAALKRLRDRIPSGGRVALANWQAIEEHDLFNEFAAVESRHLAPLGVSYEELIAPFSLNDADHIRSLLEAAGFSKVEIVPHSIEARFPSPKTFARNMETAYGAVIPAFVGDPSAFSAFVTAVEEETRGIVERFTQGDWVVCTMTANLARAYAA
jgi:ubiquinone/menaquinone biosynthesis C-methylase UbiE